MLWRDPETGRQTSLTYDDEREAIVAKKLIEAAGGYVAEANRIAEAIKKPGPTVAQAVAEHIELLTAVGSDTRAHYRQQMTAHIIPTLGIFPVAALSYRQVAGWVADLSKKGLAPKTIANVHGLFSASMATAVRLGYRPDNPCAGVLLPKSQSTSDDMTVLTRDEFMLLLSKVSPYYQPLVLTLVTTGLRWGEATALTAGDVDLVSRPATIRVTKAWKRDENRRWYVGPPKTKRARRTVSLPDDLVDVLFPVVAGKAMDELLFTNTVGAQLQSSRFWTTTWTPALEAARNPRRPDGSPDLDAPRLSKRPRVHDLRHTHASWMIAAGTDLFVLQRRLGHESITTTTETYAHLLPDQQRAAADAASRALAGLTLGTSRTPRVR
ncbi:site-specific integrase [uncultured Cellulomonas sp.]|uniref:tyrosine-type recombinase/integrase n=1 Tax=uncultured Cellulomonas sp. TaxID=189682 RepID=UPI00262D92DD|nr:site-specific integrase [uncultured Cellulomonas sp.]